MIEVPSLILIGIYWILVGLIFFLLWNFRDYLTSKPPGYQTLLDGANIHLIEYLSSFVFIFDMMSVIYELSCHEINENVADLISWILLTQQQVFYYQFLICGIVRLSIVMNWNSPINDEKGQCLNCTTRI